MTTTVPTHRVRTRPGSTTQTSPHSQQPDDARAVQAHEPASMKSEASDAPVPASVYHRQKQSSDSYEVGYKRPPRQHQFKPGQRANPKGRPKGAKNMSTLAHETAYAKVQVRGNGRTTKMSKLEIGLTKLANRFAETGDPKYLVALQKLLEPSTSGDRTQAQTLIVAPETRQAVNRRLLDWYLGCHGVNPQHEGCEADEAGTDEVGSQDVTP